MLNEQTMENVSITHGDFLRFDLLPLGRLKVAGNVPYQITTPILCYLFGEIGEPKPWSHNIDSVVLTVQYEVAQRFVATPGVKEYSKITLLTNYFAQAEILKVLPSECFYPKPKVTSAVVRLTPFKAPAVTCTNAKLLRQLIKAGFSQRRKMLRNNLSFLKLDEKTLDKIYSDLHLDPQSRAERLTLGQFARFADAVQSIRDAD
jgi:16S rRNA (adenine1518-N6/adenine1519-N6)-dimethyltransferase